MRAGQLAVAAEHGNNSGDAVNEAEVPPPAGVLDERDGQLGVEHGVVPGSKAVLGGRQVAQAVAGGAQRDTGTQPCRRGGKVGDRPGQVLGTGPAAEARLLAAWQGHDRVRDAFVGAAAALHLAAFCLVAGRIPEAIEWAERAARVGAAPAAVRHDALGVLAIALFADGRGPEGLARLAFLPAAPSEVPREDTGTLVMRGMASAALHARRARSRTRPAAPPPC